VNFEDKERTAWNEFDRLLCNTPYDSLNEVEIGHLPSNYPENVKEQIYALIPKLIKRLGEQLTFIPEKYPRFQSDISDDSGSLSDGG